MTKAMFCCGTGLQNDFFPEEALPVPKTWEDRAGFARHLLWGQPMCQEQALWAPQAPSAKDSACRSSGGACSKANPYLFRHEAPSYPPAA